MKQKLDELIEEFANKLAEIHNKNTVGDYTFQGVLYEFAIKAQPELARTYVPGEEL